MREMFILRWFTCLLLSLVSLSAQKGELSPLVKKERPDWVITSQPPLPEEDVAKSGGSIRYLLSDIQHHLEEDIWYHHLAVEILSEAGVEDYSQLDFQFQPEYERVHLYELTIIRDGEVIDRLPSTQSKIIQREEGMDSQLYDGEHTLLLILNDIRPGDILSYAFATEGLNPIFDNRHHSFARLSYGIPMNLVKRRVLWNPLKRDLQWRVIGEAQPPIERELTKETAELFWEVVKLTRHTPEDRLPSWAFDYSWLEYSDYKNWEEFGKWGRDIYLKKDSLPDEIQLVCEELKAQADNEEELIVKVLRWVQRNIRYLGSFMGEHTHRPYSLTEIAQRRFGDCKDQGMLTTAMLRHLGFDAAPAVVNTTRKKAIADYLPGHSTFNHLIVHLRWQEEDYWLDPTYTFQGGLLKDLHMGEWAYAFVMRENENELISLKTRGFDVDQTTIEEEFNILNKEGEAKLLVTTRYTGGDANSVRRKFATDSLDEIGESYLEFYQTSYPETEASAPLSFQDDREHNLFTVTESYQVKSLWEPTEEGRSIEFEAHLLNDKISVPEDKKRTQPYRVSYPNRLTHIINIKLPVEWDLTPVNDTIEHPSFRFSSETELGEKALRLEYNFEALTSSISSENYESYRKGIDKVIYENINYQLDDEATEVAEVETENFKLGLPLWVSGVVLGGIIGLIISLLVFFFWNPRPRLATTHEHIGLGGWLILPIIGCLLNPFSALFLISSYNPVEEMEPVLQAESIFYGWRLYYFSGAFIETIFFFLSILTLVLLFTKRTCFPFIYITLVIYVTITEFYMILLESQLEDIEQSDERALEISKTILRAVLWGSYMIVSQRVRATFTHYRGRKTPPPIPATELSMNTTKTI